MKQYTGESEKKGIPRKVFPLFRKHSTVMNRSIWILPGIAENSSQIEGTQGYLFVSSSHAPLRRQSD